MNQQKIGAFLKELRCGEKMTQGQLAEHLGVSNRTVSRWETGYNMPDLTLIIELATFYKVEIGEILNGERKASETRLDLEGTVRTVAAYSSQEKEKLTRKMHWFSLVGLVSMLTYFLLLFVASAESLVTGFLSGFTLGIALGSIILSAIFTSKYQANIRSAKLRVWRKLVNWFTHTVG